MGPLRAVKAAGADDFVKFVKSAIALAKPQPPISSASVSAMTSVAL